MLNGHGFQLQDFWSCGGGLFSARGAGPGELLVSFVG